MRLRRTRSVALTAILALAGLASAQTLDLTPPAAPQPGDFAAAVTMATSLEEEAAAIRNGRVHLGVDSFDVAIRELAASLLRDSDSAAGASRPDLSRRVILAMTLARRSDDLGAWLDAFTPPPAAIEAAARDLAALQASAPDLDADALARGVRNALAPLWPTTSRVYAAWSPEPALRAAIEQATAIAPAPDWLTPESATELNRLGRLVTASGSSPAHAHAARVIAYRESVARELASNPPGTFDASATQILRDAYANAILAATPDPGVASDALPLARLAAISALARDAATLPPASGPRNMAPDPSRVLGTNLGAILAESAPDSLRRLETAHDLVRDAMPDPIDEKTLPRPLRVVLRQLQPAAAASRLALVETASRVLDPTTSLSDPAVLGARAVHRSRVNDLVLISHAARAITVPDSDATTEEPTPASPEGPRIRPELAPASAYLLRLGQDLGKPELRDAALLTLRETCQTIIAAWATPSEEAMRALPDEREQRILARLDAARAAFLLALADPRRRDIEAPAAELRAIGAALALRDACALDSFLLARLIDWPGFEISPRTVEALENEAKAATDAALNAIAVDPAAPLDAAGALVTIAQARERALPWRVVATLARDAAATGSGPDTASAPVGSTNFPFAECGAGAPDTSAWMHAYVLDLADFCRSAEEWTIARAGRDAHASAMFDRAMRAAASRIGID